MDSGLHCSGKTGDGKVTSSEQLSSMIPNITYTGCCDYLSNLTKLIMLFPKKFKTHLSWFVNHDHLEQQGMKQNDWEFQNILKRQKKIRLICFPKKRGICVSEGILQSMSDNLEMLSHLWPGLGVSPCKWNCCR